MCKHIFLIIFKPWQITSGLDYGCSPSFVLPHDDPKYDFNSVMPNRIIFVGPFWEAYGKHKNSHLGYKKVLLWCHLSNCNIYTGKSAYPNRINPWCPRFHYDDVIMTMLASQITSLAVVYSIVYSGVDQRKHQSSASLAFVREIHRGPVNFPQKWPVTRKIFPFDYVIMLRRILADQQNQCCYLAPFC